MLNFTRDETPESIAYTFTYSDRVVNLTVNKTDDGSISFVMDAHIPVPSAGDGGSWQEWTQEIDTQLGV